MNAAQRKQYDADVAAFQAAYKTYTEALDKVILDVVTPNQAEILASGQHLLGSGAIVHARLKALEAKAGLNYECPGGVPVKPVEPEKPE